MKGIALDFHGWRGFHGWGSEPDLFHFRVTLGWLTVWACRFCVTDRLHRLARQIAVDTDQWGGR